MFFPILLKLASLFYFVTAFQLIQLYYETKASSEQFVERKVLLSYMDYNDESDLPLLPHSASRIIGKCFQTMLKFMIFSWVFLRNSSEKNKRKSIY